MTKPVRPLAPDRPSTDSVDGRVLRASAVTVQFQGVVALDDVSLTLEQGSITGLIGPNGAGKTTMMNVLSGFQRPTDGEVLLDAKNATRWPPHRFAPAGVARTFQSIRLFKALTVVENVEIGAIALGSRRAAARNLSWEFLQRLGMDEVGGLSAAALSQGDERKVGILRALAMEPTFLLLDEPAAGLSPADRVDLMDLIARTRDEFDCGVLVIEHDMEFIMRLCDRIQVIDHGKTIAIGEPEEVRNSTVVRDAYLGHSGDGPQMGARECSR